MNEPQEAPPSTSAEQTTAPVKEPPAAKPVPSQGVASRLLATAQLPLAIIITIGALAYLLWPGGQASDDTTQSASEPEIVKLVGQHRLAITAGTALEKKLEVATVVQQETRAPKLKVIGAVVARVPPSNEKSPSPPAPLPKGEGSEMPSPLSLLPKAEGRESPSPVAPPAKEAAGPAGHPQKPVGSPAEGRWDFNTPDLASAYADWLKARADVPFYEKQLEDIRKLADETLKAKKEVRDRLEKLVKAGTDPEKDLAAAKADYLQATAQSQKDEHEALTNVNNAKRTLATLERQLFQAGMDPELLANPTESTAIVAAEVPEGRIGLAEKGQDCIVRFSALPDQSFPGSVRSLAPTISKDRRTLRVFFQLSDPQGQLKPGMFAEVSLGTDLRKTLRIPADGVLHVGQSDYVLVETAAPGGNPRVGAGPGDWQITEITTGEQYGNRIEVLKGLQPGDRVIGYGAILLKPYVVQDVQATADASGPGSSLPPSPKT